MNILRKLMWKVLGISSLNVQLKALAHKYDEQIDTLHFFLNTLVDIKSFPKDWDKDLYIMQQCDVQLLRIVDALLRKHNIDYWLDYGTLLGAIRHGGFIPWDDDMDISTTSDNYDKIKDVLPKELAQFNIDFKVSDGRIGISYNHEKTGIWLDVFEYDELKSCETIKQLKYELDKKNKLWLKKAIPFSKKKTEKEMTSLKKYMFELPGQGNHNYLLLSPTYFWPRVFVFEESNIFPVKNISFAGYLFKAPANAEICLQECYGKSFMLFPKSGVLHHDMGRGPLSTWAKLGLVDMYQVHEYLKDIADQLSDKAEQIEV